MVRTTDQMKVTLTAGEWVKGLVLVTLYTLAIYGYLSRLEHRIAVLEEKAAATQQMNQRFDVIEADVKRILERMPRK
jgi:hypothetical protein